MQDGHYSMLFVLPNKHDALDAVETKMQAMDLDTILEKLELTKVELYILKFKMEADFDLKNTLMNVKFNSVVLLFIY